MRHLLTLFDLRTAEVGDLFTLAAKLKHAPRSDSLMSHSLAGRVLGLVFEKPSLRTRVSFQTAMAQLGGSSVYMAGQEVGLGTRETIADGAKVLSSYLDIVVLRTHAHVTIEEFAAYSRCPVINGLSNLDHPCQALADLFTVQEHYGTVTGKTLVHVGDGNNVARAVAVACAHLGVRFRLAAPPGYTFDEQFLTRLRQQFPTADVRQDLSLPEALCDADILYTDVWTSMGQEAEHTQRLKDFAAYQVNAKLLTMAPKQPYIMHCLPAHRGEEITAEVLEGPRSIVFAQAENRMHVQKALLVWLLEGASEHGT
jgi:ornithine carbamoyltransferase